MLGGMDCNDSFQYVPLLPGLCGLLYNDAIFDEVNYSYSIISPKIIMLDSHMIVNIQTFYSHL